MIKKPTQQDKTVQQLKQVALKASKAESSANDLIARIGRIDFQQKE